MSDEAAIAAPEGALCGGCATYAHGWMGSNWKCRRAERAVNESSEACSKWHPLPPDQEPDWAALRNAATALDGLLDGVTIGFEPIPYPPRPRPDGLRGHTGGVVYFIDCSCLTKIGYTSGMIEDRMKGIATNNPFDLTLWGLVKGDVKFEREWHAEFARFRYRNEWFRLSPAARGDVKRLIVEHGGELYE